MRFEKRHVRGAASVETLTSEVLVHLKGSSAGILVAPPLLEEFGILSEPLCAPGILLSIPFTAVSGFLALSSCHLALGVAGR